MSAVRRLGEVLTGTAEVCHDVDDSTLGDLDEVARLGDSVDVVMFELVGLSSRIRAACERAVNNTPRPVPVKPVQPKPQPDPEPPKDTAPDDLAPRDHLWPVVAGWWPIGADVEGYPMYQRSDLDDRHDRLVAAYKSRERGLINPEWATISTAFLAITDPCNLALAEEAVDVLRELVERAQDRARLLSGETWMCGFCGDVWPPDRAADHIDRHHRGEPTTGQGDAAGIVQRVAVLEDELMSRTGGLDDRVRVLEATLRHVLDEDDNE